MTPACSNQLLLLDPLLSAALHPWSPCTYRCSPSSQSQCQELYWHDKMYCVAGVNTVSSVYVCERFLQ